MEKSASFGRDLIKLFLQFMGIALCSIPTTLIYFLVLDIGTNSLLARVVSLSLGGGLAYLVWRFLDKRIRFAVKQTMSIPNSVEVCRTNFVHTDSFRLVGIAATFAAFVLSGTQPVMTLEFSRLSQRVGTTSRIVIPGDN